MIDWFPSTCETEVYRYEITSPTVVHGDARVWSISVPFDDFAEVVGEVASYMNRSSSREHVFVGPSFRLNQVTDERSPFDETLFELGRLTATTGSAVVFGAEVVSDPVTGASSSELHYVEGGRVASRPYLGSNSIKNDAASVNVHLDCNNMTGKDFSLGARPGNLHLLGGELATEPEVFDDFVPKDTHTVTASVSWASRISGEEANKQAVTSRVLDVGLLGLAGGLASKWMDYYELDNIILIDTPAAGAVVDRPYNLSISRAS